MGGGQPGGGSETEAAMAAAAAEGSDKMLGSAAPPWLPQWPEQPARALFPSDFDSNNGRPAAEPPVVPVLRPKALPAALAPPRPHRAHAGGPGLFRVRPRRARSFLRRRLALLPSNRTSPTTAFSGATAIVSSKGCAPFAGSSGKGTSATSSPPATFLLFSGCPASLSTRQPLQPRQLLLQLPATCKRTAAKAAETAPQRQSKLLPFQRRFAQLQAFLAAADAAAASDELVEELQALSNADRMEHRRNLERRALWLSAIEACGRAGPTPAKPEMCWQWLPTVEPTRDLTKAGAHWARLMLGRHKELVDDAQRSLPPPPPNRDSTSGPQPLWLSASTALTTSGGGLSPGPKEMATHAKAEDQPLLASSQRKIEAVAFDTQMLANFFLVSLVPFLNSSVASGAPALAAPVVANAGPLPVASAAAAAAAARNTTRRPV
eukprot:SM000107S14052  [mRNA]  locus=s107:246085:248142:+ [translate_table: standard]